MTPDARVHACLECAFLGGLGKGQSLAVHVQETGHRFAAEWAHYQVFCHACGDYVYDSEFDAIVREENARARAAAFSAQAKPFRTWHPSERDAAVLSKHGLRADTPQGSALRGLINMGSTCYMNSVLQMLIHNPLLRNYFLGDSHNRLLCQNRAKNTCLACHIDELILLLFSGDRAPITPHRFLHSMWQYAESLAGYQQQDAHEFLISILNKIHADCNGSENENECACVIHRVFSGRMRSDVTCLTCGNVSRRADPFFDISLDVHANDTGRATLLECLDHYTSIEHLGEERVFCEKCNSTEPSHKQLSIAELPAVLTLHLKRFKHEGMESHKISTLVDFPGLYMDMSPYTAEEIGRQSSTVNGDGVSDASPPSDTSDALTYELLGVVIHKGEIDSGHYINYVRENDCWFKCDDDKITNVSLREVLDQEAYLLLYGRRQLLYRAAAPEDAETL